MVMESVRSEVGRQLICLDINSIKLIIISYIMLCLIELLKVKLIYHTVTVHNCACGMCDLGLALADMTIEKHLTVIFAFQKTKGG